jgi:hypothetical protein
MKTITKEEHLDLFYNNLDRVGSFLLYGTTDGFVDFFASEKAAKEYAEEIISKSKKETLCIEERFYICEVKSCLFEKTELYRVTK